MAARFTTNSPGVNGGGDNILFINESGTLSSKAIYVGSEDTTRGVLSVFGDDSTGGGLIAVYNSADEDTTYDYFLWEAQGDQLSLSTDVASNRFKISAAGGITTTSNNTLGNDTIDVTTNVGRMVLRSVTDSGMTATAGTQAEIVFNTSDSKFYGCTVTGSPATWSALN